MATWEEKLIGRKLPVLIKESGLELDPGKMPESLVGNWKIDGDAGDPKLVFRIYPLSGYRSNVIIVISVTTDSDFRITDIDLGDSYGFPDCIGRPWSIDLQTREVNQVARLLKGMVGLLPLKAVVTKNQGPWFF